MIQFFSLIFLCTLLLPVTAVASDYSAGCKRRDSSGTTTPISTISYNETSDSDNMDNLDSGDEEVAELFNQQARVSHSPKKRPAVIEWDKPYCATALTQRVAQAKPSGLSTILSKKLNRVQSKSTSPVASYSVASLTTPVALRIDSATSASRSSSSVKTPLSATNRLSTTTDDMITE